MLTRERRLISAGFHRDKAQLGLGGLSNGKTCRQRQALTAHTVCPAGSRIITNA